MTLREHEALEFIKSFIGDKGYAPSYGEIAEHIGFKSKHSVNRLVVSLEDQGRIRRNNGSKKYKARCIEIIHAPLETWVHIGELARKLVGSIKAENVDDATGEGTVTVDAKAFGDLDVALKEASEKGGS